MINVGATCIVGDNSGAKSVKCIKVLRKSKASAVCGDIVVVSIRKVIPKALASIKKGEVCLAVIIRQKSQFLRKDGSVIKFDENAVVLLDKQQKMLGTRVFGVVPREVRKNFPRVAALVKEVV
jgi:large subunit ribosomal protein L14